MAYAERTEVTFTRSINEIMTLIRKAGADQVGQFIASLGQGTALFLIAALLGLGMMT